MKTIRKDASLHPKTVTELSQGEYDMKKVHSHKRNRSTVNHIHVDPRVWTVAMKLCRNDISRLQVVSSDEVIVHNNSWRTDHR